MKKFQKWMGVLLVAFAASSLVVACGDEDDASCIVDGDCYDDELCNLETETCGFNCTDNADACEADETCSPVAESGSVCVYEGTADPECTVETDCAAGQICNAAGMCEDEGGKECEDATDCDEATQICNSDNMCEDIGSDPYYFAQLVDTTTDDDACSNTDPGSDIFGIELTKEADGSKAYAMEVNAVINDRSNEEPNTRGNYEDILNGSAPTFKPNTTCAEFSVTFSMGCGGNVVVKFLDAAGNLVEISNGDTITPMEWGGTCGGDTKDTWSLFVCEAGVGENALIGDTNACAGIAQGEGFGDNAITVKDL